MSTDLKRWANREGEYDFAPTISRVRLRVEHHDGSGFDIDVQGQRCLDRAIHAYTAMFGTRPSDAPEPAEEEP